MLKRVKFDFSSCMKIEMIFVSLIIFFTLVKQGALISLCFSMSFIVLLCYAVYRATNTRYSLNLVLLIIVAFVNVVVNALTSSEAILGFDYFKKLLMFLAFMLMLDFAQNDDISVDTYNLVLRLPSAMALMLVCSYFFVGNTDRYAGGITLGFSNPNFTGMWLVHLFIYVFLLEISIKHNRFIKITIGLVLVIMAWLIYETKARSCLIGLFLFLLLCVMGKVTNESFSKKPIVWSAVILIPIIVVLLYQSLLNAGWFVNAFAAFVSDGKGLDSRLAVWQPAIKAFMGSPIFGDYCGISQGTGTSQLHNTHLDVLVSYGILPFVLFVVALLKLSRNITRHDMSFFSYTAFSGFLSIIIIGTFEAGVVSGAMGLNILTVGLIVLANYDGKECNV